MKKGGTHRGSTTPSRGTCPRCNKKGLGPWKPYPNPVKPCHLRECRYCRLTQIGECGDDGRVNVVRQH